MDEIDELRREVAALRERLRASDEKIGQLLVRVEGFACVLDDIADYVMADEQEKRSREDAHKQRRAEQALLKASERRGAKDWRSRARGMSP